MLVNASIMLQMVSAYRLVWIMGRFGGGKTALSYRIAQEFLEHDYRLISNNKSVWSDDMSKVDLLPDGHLKSVVILDEGGLEFKASKQIEMVAAYAAKMDCIYIIPSFFPPSKSAQVLVIQPLFNFKAAGIPIIVYRWRVRLGGFEDKGSFWWWKPSEIYGIYSRQDPGDRAGEIVNYLIDKTGEYRKYHGRGDNELQTMEVEQSDIFQEAVSNLSDVVDQWSTVSIRKRGRR